MNIRVRTAGKLNALLSQSRYSLTWIRQRPDILPTSNRPHQFVIDYSRVLTSRVQLDMNGYRPCVSLIIEQ